MVESGKVSNLCQAACAILRLCQQINGVSAACIHGRPKTLHASATRIPVI
jgi:hypothetical protein